MLLYLAFSVIHGVIDNVWYVMSGVAKSHALLINSIAMALGDFLGCFIIVSVFHLFTLLLVMPSRANDAMKRNKA